MIESILSGYTLIAFATTLWYIYDDLIRGQDVRFITGEGLWIYIWVGLTWPLTYLIAIAYYLAGLVLKIANITTEWLF